MRDYLVFEKAAVYPEDTSVCQLFLSNVMTWSCEPDGSPGTMPVDSPVHFLG